MTESTQPARLEIQYKRVEDLMPYTRNAKKHSDAQVEKIANSIKEFGFNNPILLDGENGLVAGHGRLLACKYLGLVDVPTIELSHLSEAHKRAYCLADNRLSEIGCEWDQQMLSDELSEIFDGDLDLDFNVDFIGFDETFFITEEDERQQQKAKDETPELKKEAVTVEGDVWLLGDHRVMCGDSTDALAVAKLMGDRTAALVHADPPYGMGKEFAGVMNDNLYNEKLDEFQMDWWHALRWKLDDNASAYIWGNAPGLWRLWYSKLEPSEKLELRNQITWDKKWIPGQKSPLLTQYPEVTEHCLFFQLGEQFLGAINKDDFPDHWLPLLEYLTGEAEKQGVTGKTVREVCKCHMFSHWFSKSQFSLIPEKHYQALREACGGFDRPWQSLKSEWDSVRWQGNQVKKENLTRSYFDNAHDVMSDVWDFPRVVGDERHEHATPKPVAMMERVMKSSLPRKGLCIEPFGGSGSTLMGAEITGRHCFTMELSPVFCDVIVRRWQTYTDQTAVHAVSGKPFET